MRTPHYTRAMEQKQPPQPPPHKTETAGNVTVKPQYVQTRTTLTLNQPPNCPDTTHA